MQKDYKIKAKLWEYPGKAAWHFVTVPEKTAEDIDFFFSDHKRGWGSLPVTVTINNTVWKTSIFPDKKTKTYLLPIKVNVRKENKIVAGDNITFSLLLDFDD